MPFCGKARLLLYFCSGHGVFRFNERLTSSHILSFNQEVVFFVIEINLIADRIREKLELIFYVKTSGEKPTNM